MRRLTPSRTDFASLLENYDAYLASSLLLELFKTNGCAQASWSGADDTDIDFVTGALSVGWIEELALSPNGCGVQRAQTREPNEPAPSAEHRARRKWKCVSGKRSSLKIGDVIG